MKFYSYFLPLPVYDYIHRIVYTEDLFYSLSLIASGSFCLSNPSPLMLAMAELVQGKQYSVALPMPQ